MPRPTTHTTRRRRQNQRASPSAIMCCSVVLFISSIFLLGVGGMKIGASKFSGNDYFKDIIEQERRIGTILLAVGGVLMAISLLCCCYGTGLYARNQARNAPSSNAFPTTTMTNTITIPAHQYNPSSSPNPRSNTTQLTPGPGSFPPIPAVLTVDLSQSSDRSDHRHHSPVRGITAIQMEPRSTMMTDLVNSTRVDLDLPSYDEAMMMEYPVII